MQALHTLALVLPSSVTSGINLYATVLVMGLGIRFGYWSDAPDGLNVLASWPVIVVAAILYVVEFVVDKFNFLDDIWDVAHTFVRPPAAALLAFLASYGEVNPALTVVATLIGGAAGLVSHGGKSGSRVALNVASPGEFVTNCAVSIGEDIFAAGLVALSFKYPYIAAGIACVVLILILFVGPRLLRWGWFRFKATFARVVALVKQRREADSLRGPHLAALDHETPEIASRCRTQRIRWVAGRSGYVSILTGRVAFTYTKWFWSTRVWQVAMERVRAVYFRRRWFTDVLEVHYKGARHKDRMVRFVFTRYRSPLAVAIGRSLKAQGLPDTPSPNDAQPASATAPA